MPRWMAVEVPPLPCLAGIKPTPGSGRRASSIDRSLLSMADQHGAARGRELRAIFLQASQDRKIALIHQLPAEALDVAGASLLLLLGAAMGKDTGRSCDRQQG